ncbi:hypothetical protein [Acinetobacter shaoyimingii]|uniref:Nitric oxide reductase n=2 Tax=Acinetobacter shaoyimingii TaxID=2715164 RepID=A0A6G8RX95_9GAMM|nr:hypothetical protein [Acinetobacter shaoyimingii]QIO06495.1 hypothetical protein G8E00_11290 [Acinetobacter shaoyimingii]
MSFDLRFSWPIFLAILMCLCFPLVQLIHSNAVYSMTTVHIIEAIQAVLLLIFAISTYVYMKPLQLSKGRKLFWIWAVCWWVVLLGRSTSWGRDYFPEIPKIFFRGVSILLIASVVFPLLNAALRREIANKFKNGAFSLWAVILVIFGLMISDAIEHHRFIGNLFVYNVAYRDLMEELYEFPLIIGLFIVAFQFMKQDKQSDTHIEVN